LRRYFPPDYASAREVEEQAQKLEIAVRAAQSEEAAKALLRNSQHGLVFMSAARRVESNMGSMEFPEQQKQDEEKYYVNMTV